MTANVMVDSVLPPPVIEKISEPVVKDLVGEGVIAPIYEGGGARCAPDGAVIDHRGDTVKGLWIVGRLTNGSTIADDSIHDCFGDVTERWAAKVLR